jgi:hypothetical protein
MKGRNFMVTQNPPAAGWTARVEYGALDAGCYVLCAAYKSIRRVRIVVDQDAAPDITARSLIAALGRLRSDAGADAMAAAAREVAYAIGPNSEVAEEFHALADTYPLSVA